MYSKSSVAFQVNDYIFHGGSGVCKIQDICTPDTQRTDPNRTYYRLLPLYDRGSVIYTPTDNANTIVRKILSRQEACQLIQEIPFLETICVENDKYREEAYREALRTNDCYQWIRVIKTLYQRNKARRQEGKQISRTNEKYLRIAEDLLFGELAISLDIPKEQVGDFILRQTDPLGGRGDKCS